MASRGQFSQSTSFLLQSIASTSAALVGTSAVAISTLFVPSLVRPLTAPLPNGAEETATSFHSDQYPTTPSQVTLSFPSLDLIYDDRFTPQSEHPDFPLDTPPITRQRGDNLRPTQRIVRSIAYQCSTILVDSIRWLVPAEVLSVALFGYLTYRARRVTGSLNTHDGFCAGCMAAGAAIAIGALRPLHRRFATIAVDGESELLAEDDYLGSFRSRLDGVELLDLISKWDMLNKLRAGLAITATVLGVRQLASL